MDVYTIRTLKALVGELASWKSLVAFISVSLIFAWLPDGIVNLFKEEYATAAAQLGVSALLLAILYTLVRMYSSKQIPYRVELSEKRDFKVLVIFLSKLSEDDLDKIIGNGNEKSKKRGIKSMEDLRKEHLSWEMPIIAINTFLNTLEHVFIIPSFESKEQVEAFKDLVKKVLEQPDGIKMEELGPVDFEDIEALQEVVKRAYERAKELGYKDKDVVIDTTGGKKPVSIASFAMTVLYPTRYFMYVSTDTKDVKVFNMNILS